MKKLNIEPLQFLSAFHDFPDEPVFFRAFDDTKQSKVASNRTVYADNWEAEYKTLKEANDRKCGIYFVVNGGGNADAEVKTAKAQFVEMDDVDFDEQFVRVAEFALEPSIIVKTKKSLHCYWLLKNGDIGRFRDIQRRLIAQFKGDAVCKNESRVMRVPGFYHCKGTPVMVECVKFNPELTYTQDDLDFILPAAPKEEHTGRVNVGCSIIQGGRNQTLFRLACSLQQQGLSDAAIQGAIETENKTKCSPPLEDEEVQKIIESSLRYQKGTILVSDETTAPATVEDVPKWTAADYDTNDPYAWLYSQKSQGELRETILRDKIRVAAAGVGVKNFVQRYNAYCKAQARKSGKSLEPSTEFAEQPIELMAGEYTCNEYGVSKMDRFGNSVSVISHAILPLRRLVNVDTGEVKIEIAYRRGRGWRTVVCDKRMLSSSQKIIDLAMYGIGVNSQNAPDVVKFLTDVEEMNYDKIEEVNSVGRLGWIGSHGFSPYVGNLSFDGEMCFKSAFKAVTERGSFDKWIDLCKEARQHGTISRITLAASFASVLVEPFNLRPFFVHLWGGAGSGKTVALMLAASVWADPQIGEYIHTFNSTSVGQEMMAGFVNSMPLCIDELQVIKDKRDFDNIIYTLAEGTGRSRGAKQGGIQRMQTWRNCILTTGEMPICGSLSGGGAVDRVVEIDCKDEMIFKDFRLVVETLLGNYGYGGKWFVDWISDVDNMASARTYFDSCYSELIKPDATARQALAGSLILTADYIVSSCLFKDDRFLTVEEIGQHLSTNAQRDVNERAFEWILDLVSSNPARFKPNTNTGEYLGECWGCVDSEHAFIIKSVFDARMNDAGFSPTAFLSWAKRENKIECDSGRTTKIKRVTGLTSAARCVCIRIPLALEETMLPHDTDGYR